MGIDKQSISVNFGQGIDTLNDPNQLPLGKFTSLQNSQFVQGEGGGKLNKRFGFTPLTSLPDANSSYLTTYRGGLVALGKDLKTYFGKSAIWGPSFPYTPITLSTTPLSNTAASQVQIDTAISPNGLICMTCATNVAALSQSPPGPYGYTIFDQATGNQVVAFTQIVPLTGELDYPYAPKVFALGDYFGVVFGATTGSTGTLQCLQISTKNTASASYSTIGANYYPINTGSTSSFDGVVASNSLYLSWNTRYTSATGNISGQSLGSTFSSGGVVVIASASASLISVCADITKSPPTIWTSGFLVGTGSGTIVATNIASGYKPIFSAKTYTSSQSANLASVAQNGVMSLYSEIPQTFVLGTNSNIAGVFITSNFINTINVIQSTASVSTNSTLIRGMGLASKGFIVNSSSYFMGVYNSSPDSLQSTYFLVASNSLQVAKLEYGNAQGYINGTLPSVSVTGSSASLGYIYNTALNNVNKSTNVSSSSQVGVVTYASTGTALVNLEFNPNKIVSTELGDNLNINGGFLWAYDGQTVAEHNFHLYPDYLIASSLGVSGSLSSLSAQSYFYVGLYEWRDAKGNIFRSAPSIPQQVSLSGATPYITTITMPSIRVTNKSYFGGGTVSLINVKVYRWSANQQNYYLAGTAANSLTSDTVLIIDNQSDSQILGNELLYTTGGVLEDSATPACAAVTAFDTRLWMIDSEDDNLLLYSKPMVEGAPVEMSDLQTYFVPPNVSGTQSTGGVKSFAAMDDKLILFKKNTIYYISGTGPDATGANSQYSPPIFITGGVGCSNQKSIVLMPNGLMFQSDKGIWLLGRDLSISFIGKEAEDFNNSEIFSSFVVPGTNEARFTLGSSKMTLMYDYFAGQWAQISGVPNIYSTIYENKHTFLSSSGSVSQQSTSSFADGGTPTTMSFTTGWINLAGLQGYVRAYRMYILGKFYSPHTYTMGIAYDYNPTIIQTATINPTNSSGSGSFIEQWQINFQNQQTQSFQLTFNEIASSTAGQGLSLSGIKLVIGMNKDFPRNIGVANKTG